MEMHIGHIIKEEIERQGRTKVWFAKAINRSNSTCYNIFNSATIDTGLLQTISHALGRDFFKLYSDTLTGTKAK
ncbi:MAG: XRE family transcriptional regulator [Bacteroidales bacterium]|nr:XRE family transcriptional regulator [Bacteroidales bacterium]